MVKTNVQKHCAHHASNNKALRAANPQVSKCEANTPFNLESRIALTWFSTFLKERERGFPCPNDWVYSKEFSDTDANQASVSFGDEKCILNVDIEVSKKSGEAKQCESGE